MDELRIFFERIRDDHRVGTAHVSMYAALVGLYLENGGVGFIAVRREELMARSKILGKTTYYTVLRELAEWGYVEYRPERARGRVSGVRI